MTTAWNIDRDFTARPERASHNGIVDMRVEALMPQSKSLLAINSDGNECGLDRIWCSRTSVPNAGVKTFLSPTYKSYINNGKLETHRKVLAHRYLIKVFSVHEYKKYISIIIKLNKNGKRYLHIPFRCFYIQLALH